MATLLRGGTLLDGTGAAPRPNAALLIEGERIVRVGDLREVNAPPHATVLDCAGKTIMPGLIDCHDHLVHTNRDLNERSTRPLSLTMMLVAEQSARDRRRRLHDRSGRGRTGSRLQTGDRTGVVVGPRLLISLSILSRTGRPRRLPYPERRGSGLAQPAGSALAGGGRRG